jgi:uncharacterized protein (DUF983 family)
MSLRCPNCQSAFSFFGPLRLYRLVSVRCTHCGSIVRLDRKGRLSLYLTLCVAILIGAGVAQLVTDPTLAGALFGGFLVVGIGATCLSVPRFGTLMESSERWREDKS